MKLFIGIAILLILTIGIDSSQLDRLKDCKCRINNSQKRIVNGKIAAAGSYPWYATIELPLHANVSMLVCHATIINSDTLLTAGQCLPKFKKNLTKEILSGYKVVIKGSGEAVDIKEFIRHPNFKEGSFRLENDIGIVKLDKNITFNQVVQPGCLDTRHMDQYYIGLTVAGFGIQKSVLFLNNYPLNYDIMKLNFSEATVFDRTHELCPQHIDENICVHNDNKQAICLGDEGSSLMWTLSGRTYVIGINSKPFVKNITENLMEVCSSGSYATRLSSYTQFIDRYAGDYCNV